MKLVISNHDTGEIYETLEDATSAQLVAYLGSHLIEIDGKNYFPESVVMDHNKQTVNVLVTLEDEDEE